MWNPRNSPSRRRPSLPPTHRPTHHIRRQSTSTYFPIPPLPLRPHRNISLQDPTRPPYGPRPQPLHKEQSRIPNSFSVPWNLSAVLPPRCPSPVRVSPPQNLDNDSALEDPETQESRIVYIYQPPAYWAGRLSSVLDRLAAEYPLELRGLRVKRAFVWLEGIACGSGAEASLKEFRDVFEKRVKKGMEW